MIVPYKEFYGKNIDRMSELIAEGRVPLSKAGIMERRLNSTLSAWKDNYFGSDDAIAYNSDEKFKIVRSAPFLRLLTPESNLTNGSLVLTGSVYDSADGAEFSRKDKGLIFDRDLTAQEAKEHPVWLALVPDKALLTEYVDYMFAEMDQRFNYKRAMGVYIAGVPNVYNARALCVDRLGCGSRLYGRDGLDYDDGRLVGVAPEALGASGKMIVKLNLETAIGVVNKHLHAGRNLRVQ